MTRGEGGWLLLPPAGLSPAILRQLAWRTLAQPPTPNGPTAAACARRAFRGTRVVARRNAFSGSSSITPSGPVRPFRLASVPRPGMTNTDVRLGSSMTDTERTSHPRMCHDVSPQALTRPRDRGNLTSLPPPCGHCLRECAARATKPSTPTHGSPRDGTHAPPSRRTRPRG